MIKNKNKAMKKMFGECNDAELKQLEETKEDSLMYSQ